MGHVRNLLFYLISRCGFECPSKYNPADFFIDALAINPGKDGLEFKLKLLQGTNKTGTGRRC